jgi:hypothetical protein
MSRRRTTDRSQQKTWVREIGIGVGIAVLAALGVALGGRFADLFEEPPQPSGSVDVVHVEHSQTLRMFRREATAAAENEPLGLTIEVRRVGHDVETDGCQLRWTYLDMSGPAPVDDPALVSQPARDVNPDPRSCVTATQLWIPVTDGLEGYERVAVKVELLADGHVLGSSRSETFTLG